jgi:anti-sigma regulatory factor (Ser/Thr protein kinase)
MSDGARVAPTSDRTPGFRHEALLYAGDAEFFPSILAFLREGAARGEPALVVVDARKIRTLRAALAADADDIEFADVAEVGVNPARIIPAWRDFVDARCTSSQRVRGVGEPVWSARTDAELSECDRHEALLNVAFAPGPGWELVCPYDTSTLTPDVVAAAGGTHPLMRTSGERAQPSARWPGLAASEPHPSDALPPPPLEAIEVPFEDVTSLAGVRAVVAERARAAGIGRRRVGQIAMVVGELAANSVRHGGGRGTLRAWCDDGALVCEVRDRGVLTDPLVGRIRPSPEAAQGRGLWLANQLSDLVQIRVRTEGTTVRVWFRP